MHNKKKVSIITKIKNKFKKNKNKFNITEASLFMLITFSLGLIIGGIVMYGRGPFMKNDASLNEFIATYNEISSSYYKDVDEEGLLKAGIDGMVGYLKDPYTVYMDGDDAKSFNDDIEGIYYGIGAEIKYKDEKVYIGRVFDNSPAYKAGLLEDDNLIKVNGEEIKDMSLNKIASIVKGEKGTFVNITVIRDEKEISFDIKRGEVDSISVTSELIEKDNKKIGYIYMSIFAANSSKQFEKELKDLESKNIDSLIIDLRSNQGGYLTTATDILSLFIKKGEIIYRLKTKDKEETIYDETKEERSYPIVVLINSSSASASEVVAGGLRESYNATILGTKSFGKGKVQKISTLSNGSIVKYTYQEWLTPKGNYIDGEGIIPDVEIKYIYDKEGKDNQKEKAIEVLLSK